jgi:hypothetical protein
VPAAHRSSAATSARRSRRHPAGEPAGLVVRPALGNAAGQHPGHVVRLIVGEMRVRPDLASHSHLDGQRPPGRQCQRTDGQPRGAPSPSHSRCSVPHGRSRVPWTSARTARCLTTSSASDASVVTSARPPAGQDVDSLIAAKLRVLAPSGCRGEWPIARPAWDQPLCDAGPPPTPGQRSSCSSIALTTA